MRIEIKGKPLSANKRTTPIIRKLKGMKRPITMGKILTKEYREYQSLIGMIVRNYLLENGREEVLSWENKPLIFNLHVYSPNVLTKKKVLSKTFGDVDDFLKPLIDSIFIELNQHNASLNDGQIVYCSSQKEYQEDEYFIISLFSAI